MVASVTNLGRNGLYDWLIQRSTAVILASYTIFMLGFFVTHPDLTYVEWSEMFQSTGVRIFTLLTLLSFGTHSWIGLWTVSTDYMKATAVRFTFQAVCGIAMFVYVVWGVQIIWGL